MNVILAMIINSSEWWIWIPIKICFLCLWQIINCNNNNDARKHWFTIIFLCCQNCWHWLLWLVDHKTHLFALQCDVIIHITLISLFLYDQYCHPLMIYINIVEEQQSFSIIKVMANNHISSVLWKSIDWLTSDKT